MLRCLYHISYISYMLNLTWILLKNFIAPKDSSLNFRGATRAIFKLLCSFLPLSAFKTILAVYCQLVPWLLKHISVTVSCEIALSPKQAIDENKLSFKYGKCNNPSRTLTYRKRREVETHENFKFTMKNTVKLSSQKSDASRTHLLTILIISVMTCNIW